MKHGDRTIGGDQGGGLVAVFDPKVRWYLFLQVSFVLSASLFGILLLPFWFVVGPYWAKRYFKTLDARVEGKNFQYRHGVWFRQETSVPLEKIQDLSLLHGPLLDSLGLATLRLDTAGSAHPGSASASLVGVVGAAEFRNLVLRERNRMSEAPGRREAPGDALESTEEIRKIRESLERIEALLRARSEWETRK